MIKYLIILTLFVISNDNKLNASIINKIIINGNSRIDSSTILANIQFQENSEYNDNLGNQSIKNLYNTGYFADIAIFENKNQNNETIINIDIVENPVINDVFFIGSGKINKDDVMKEMSLKAMGFYSKDKVKTDLDKLYAVYQKIGNLNVFIEPKIVFLDKNRVDIIFNINEGDASIVSNIIFIGNNNFSDKILKENIVSKEKSFRNILTNINFEEDKLDIDKTMLTKLYLNNGYADFAIVSSSAAFDKENYNFTLTFFLNEGNVYKFNEFKIQSSIPMLKSEMIPKNLIQCKKGNIFEQNKIDETIEQLSKFLSEIGFAFVNIDFDLIKDKDNKLIDVIFNIKSAQKYYINQIFIHGNNKTKDEVIRRELVFAEGDIYNSKNIALAKDRLHMTGYFKKIDIKEKMNEKNPDLLDIIIDVEEQFFGNVNFSIGYSSFEGAIGTIQLQVNNIMGAGYSGNINATRSGWSQTYSIGLYDPYFIKKYNIGLGFNVFYSSFGDMGFGTTMYTSMIPFKGQSYGLSLNTGFELTNRLYYGINVGYSLNSSQLSGGMKLFSLYEQLLGSRQTYTIGHSLTWNRLNNARYATQGFLAKYSETYAGFGVMGNQDFIKRDIDFNSYIPLYNDDLILNLAFSGGYVQNTGKTTLGMQNLYSLGYYKMRGFSFFGLGPRIAQYNADGSLNSYMGMAMQSTTYYVGTVELQSSLIIPKEFGIKFAVFLDVGSAFGYAGSQTHSQNSNGSYEKILNSNNIRMSYGFGVLWQSPMGEIRFDFANIIKSEVYDTPMQFNIRFGSVNF